MNLTSTRQGLTRISRRFRALRAVRAHSSFKGALQPAFGEWIRGHWGFSTLGWLRPAPKDFYKQKHHYELLHGPRSHSFGETNYTFSPIIQLTWAPNASTSKFFEINGAKVFQTLPTQAIGSSFDVMRNPQGRDATWKPEIKSALSGGSRSDTPGHMNTLREVVAGKQGAVLRGPQDWKTQGARFHEFVSSLFSTVLHTAEGFTQPLVTILRQLPGTAASWKNQRNGQARFIPPRVADGPIARLGSIEWLKSTPIVHRLEQSFLSLANRFQLAGESKFQPSLVTTVALNFVAPKLAEAEIVNQRIAHFISSPALTYAKREQNLSEHITHALQDLRASQKENTVAMPQFPSVEQLTSQVRTQLERELRIERERRGI